MDNKDYKIKKDQIKRVISVKLGVAIASDEIMVQGKPVGYMERIALIPEHPEFSGWTFASGEETQEFLDNPLNSGFYNLNTIANYDAAIIPYLDSEVGTIVDLSANA
jgi:hypothetical protein